MAHDVFISFSNRDKPIADGICANLEAAGFRCWIAPRDISPGEDWPTSIAKAISHSLVMVLVFSANSNSSQDVSRELSLAVNNKLVIIPFKIEDFEPEPGKKYYLARTHWLDAQNPPTQEQTRALIERVKALIPAREPLSIVGTLAGITSYNEQPVLEPEVSKQIEAPVKMPGRVRPLWIPAILLVLIVLVGWFIFGIVTNTIIIPGALIAPSASIVSSTPTTEIINDTTSTPDSLSYAGLMAAETLTAHISTPVSTIGSWNLNMLDDFSSNLNRWPAWGYSKDNCSTSNIYIQNGGLYWSLEALDNANCTYFVNPYESAPPSDFDVSVDVQQPTDSVHGDGGIVFRAKDVDDFYTFSINNRLQSYIIQKDQNGSMTTLKDWTLDYAIQSDHVNHLAVSGRGFHFTFSINGVPVASLDDDEGYYDGYVGVGIDVYNGDSFSVIYNNFELHGNY